MFSISKNKKKKKKHPLHVHIMCGWHIKCMLIPGLVSYFCTLSAYTMGSRWALHADPDTVRFTHMTQRVEQTVKDVLEGNID